jgi:DHA1 family bicyclomycin/chloramphenicol resistance-like MFS transporter
MMNDHLSSAFRFIYVYKKMKIIKENHHGISTVLAFSLLPLSGFATDIYIPSLPAMANHLGVTAAAVQLTLVFFMVSQGTGQLFVGSLLDSFGRYRLGLASLIVFTAASFMIALAHDIHLIYAMRAVQGITVALIVVGKRAYFMDIYSGEKLKHYTSLFSIVWAASPIIAPFLGGYLESLFGWQSNFYFLGIATLSLFMLELIYGGESLRSRSPFKAKNILHIYISTLKTADFTLGLVMISLSYVMLVLFSMGAPFIIEHVFRYNPVVTGYCSLISGVCFMIGGIASKSLIKSPLNKKLLFGIVLQLLTAIIMTLSSGLLSNLVTLIVFTALVHLLSGFLFNNVFAYCLGRFSNNAAIASGITGGSLFIMTSVISYGTVSITTIKNQEWLGAVYICFALLWLIGFALFAGVRRKITAKSLSYVPQTLTA